MSKCRLTGGFRLWEVCISRGSTVCLILLKQMPTKLVVVFIIIMFLLCTVSLQGYDDDGM